MARRTTPSTNPHRPPARDPQGKTTIPTGAKTAALLALLLVVPLLAGCVSNGDTPADPGPGSTRQTGTQDGFMAAAQAAREETADEGDWVAAFALATARPERHETVSRSHPGMGTIAARLLAHPSAVPGEGDLPAWAFLYEPARGSQQLTYVVVEADGNGNKGSWETRTGTLHRDELILLRSERAMNAKPEITPAGALEAAMTDEEWKAAASGSGIFVLYTLVAGATGAPEWRLVASSYELNSAQGRLVTVDARTGELTGTSRDWPDRPVRNLENRDEDIKSPGDEETFTITVVNETHPAIHVLPRRTSTGGIIFGAPQVELHSPNGDTRELVIDEPEAVESPQAGDWEVVFTWEQPDVYRSIRLEYCMPPVPYLFAERLDICDEW